jgi:hypothetical protein
MSPLLQEALRARCVILHVMGPHAGEGSDKIFQRKSEDIRRTGKAFWYCRTTRPPQVQAAAQFNKARGEPTCVIFIGGPCTQRGRGQRKRDAGQDTNPEHVGTATHFLAGDRDSEDFKPLPPGLQVTGKMDRGAAAMVFDYLEALPEGEERRIDMAKYTQKSNDRITAWVAERLGSRGGQRRWIVGVARLLEPYGVWLRGSPHNRSSQKEVSICTQRRHALLRGGVRRDCG